VQPFMTAHETEPTGIDEGKTSSNGYVIVRTSTMDSLNEY
jgi:hypothetical protein